MSDVFESLGELAYKLSPDPTAFPTVRRLLESLIELANRCRVDRFHDSFRGLPVDLSEEFLRASLEEGEGSQFDAERTRLLEEAGEIIAVAER